jgi:hypothetical protein
MIERGREKEREGKRVGEKGRERERETENIEGFNQVSFEEAIRNGNFPKDVPFVAGFTSEEGLVKLSF